MKIVDSPTAAIDAEARRAQIFAENEPKRNEAGKLIKFVAMQSAYMTDSYGNVPQIPPG